MGTLHPQYYNYEADPSDKILLRILFVFNSWYIIFIHETSLIAF